jgi:hypothetical protein
MYVTTFLVKENFVYFKVLSMIHRMKILSFDLCGELVDLSCAGCVERRVPCLYAKSTVYFEYAKKLLQHTTKWGEIRHFSGKSLLDYCCSIPNDKTGISRNIV